MLATYHPEMGEVKPLAQIEASLGHYGKHYFLRTPLTLSGRGVELLGTYTKEDSQRVQGWNRYKVTLRAFDAICERYKVSAQILLD